MWLELRRGTRGAAQCVTNVLTIFPDPLWYVTDLLHGNMEWTKRQIWGDIYKSVPKCIIRTKWYKYVYNSRFNINTTIKRPWWGDARWRCHEWRAAMHRARSTSRCGCVQFGREYLPPPYCFFTDILLRKVRWITFLMEVFKAKLSSFSDNIYIFYCIHKRMGIQLEKLIYNLIFQKYKRDWHSL